MVLCADPLVNMFNFTITRIDERQSFDSNLVQSLHFQQSDVWTKFKSLHGWQRYCFMVEYRPKSKSNSDFTVPKFSKNLKVTVLVRTFCHFFSIAYIPMGPAVADDQSTFLLAALYTGIGKALKTFLPQNTICIRMDPPVDFDSPEKRDTFDRSILQSAKKQHLILKKSGTDIQPPDTSILDLSKSVETLFSCMKPKWRYNIRLAEKKGVTVTAHYFADADFDSQLDIFYTLFQQTAERDGIAIHKRAYLYSLFKHCNSEQKKGTDVENSLITLYLATHDGDPIAGIITLYTPDEAVYLYGASSNLKRNFMPTYLIQWIAIQAAKKYGSHYYDFYGIPPTDNPSHPMHGLYRFKTGFGGISVHRPGSLDVPLNVLYFPYTFAEQLRRFWFKKIKKILLKR